MTSELPISTPKLENGSYIRRRLEQVAMFVQDPSAPEMLASGTLNPIRAAALRAIMATPGLPGFLYGRLAVPGYRKAGFDILGIGFNAVTVSDGSQRVRKYYRHTAGESEESQEATIKVWLAKQDLALEHLGPYTIPQLFSIGEDPLAPNQSIVVATQERIVSSGSINMYVPDEVPELALPFIRDSQLMQRDSQRSAVPDLAGKDNALIEAGTDAIKLIDPITLTADDPGDKSSYTKVANFLEDFVA